MLDCSHSRRQDISSCGELQEIHKCTLEWNLDNSESKEDFLAAVNQLSLDIDCQQIQTGILALENNSYCLPNWLTRDSLLAKLKELFKL